MGSPKSGFDRSIQEDGEVISMASTSICSLCNDGKRWEDLNEFLNHFTNYHHIKPAIELSADDNVKSRSTPGPDPQGLHWRCYRYKCTSCNFVPHTSSVMEK